MMAPLKDPEVIRQFLHALSQWKYDGYINWKRTAREWVEQNVQGFTARGIGELMHKHLAAGGVVDQVTETRPEYSFWPFHYDFRLRIGGRVVYLETCLDTDDPDDPIVHVVSTHDA